MTASRHEHGWAERLLFSYLLLAVGLMSVGSLNIQSAIHAVVGWPVIYPLGKVLHWCVRWPDREKEMPRLNAQQLAYLAGGGERVYRLLLAQLARKGQLVIDHQLQMSLCERASQSLSPLEEQMVALVRRSGGRPALPGLKLNLLKNTLRAKQLILSKPAEALALRGALHIPFVFTILLAVLIITPFSLFPDLFPDTVKATLTKVIHSKNGYANFLIVWFWTGWCSYLINARGERTRWGDKVLLYHQDDEMSINEDFSTALLGTIPHGRLSSMLAEWERLDESSYDNGG